MARRRKEDAQKTRTRILASALSLFSKKGYEHTTFTDIAARLKMTKGAVYWHFASKEALLEELVRLALKKFRRQIDELMPHGELLDGLRRLLGEWWRTTLDLVAEARRDAAHPHFLV